MCMGARQTAQQMKINPDAMKKLSKVRRMKRQT
jgi:hypothetical protein